MNPTVNELRSKWRGKLGAYRGHKLDVGFTNELVEDLLNLSNQIDNEGSGNGIKIFPTTLTESDITKCVSIDSGGNAVIYAAEPHLTPPTLGVWGGKCTSLPGGTGSTVIMSLVDENDATINITNDDVLNAGPNGAITTPTEFVENVAQLINSLYSARYTANSSGIIHDIIENTQYSVAGNITSIDVNVAITETQASILPTNYYTDELPIDGTLVGINDDGDAIVDVTRLAYNTIGTNGAIIPGQIVFVDNLGCIREAISGDETESNYYYGVTLTGGNPGDKVFVNVLNNPYASIVELYNEVSLLNSAVSALQTAVANIGSFEISDIIFVDPLNGNDSEGAIGNFGKRFKTVDYAVSIASPGHWIYWLKGNHTVTGNICADGVFHFAAAGASGTSSGQFYNCDTTAGGTTITGPNYFLGNLSLNDVDGGGGGFCSIRTNPTAEIYFEFQNITVNNISNGMVLRDGYVNLKVKDYYFCYGRPFRLQDSANIDATIGGKVTCNFGSVFNAIVYSDGMSYTGTANIKAKTFEMPNAVNNQNYCRFTVGGGGKVNIELEEQSDDATGFTTPFMHVANGFQISLSIKKVAMLARPLYNLVTSGELLLKDTKGTIEGASSNASYASWENVHVNIAGGVTNTISVLNASTIRTRDCTIDSSNFSYDNITLDATSTAKLRDTLLVLDGTGNSVVNPAGSVLTMMDVYMNYTVSVPLGAVGQFYVDTAFTV